MEEKMSKMESIKVILVTLIAFAVPVGLTSIILNKLFKLNYLVGAGIGLVAIIAIIIILGLYKPVYENENKNYNEEDED